MTDIYVALLGGKTETEIIAELVAENVNMRNQMQ